MSTELLTDRIRLIALVINSGRAFETATPVPIRSGGSMAILSGFSDATAALTPGVSVQTRAARSETLARDKASSISEILILLSEWFRIVPDAPAAFTASANMWPV